MTMSLSCREAHETAKRCTDIFQVTFSPTWLSEYLSPKHLIHFGGTPEAQLAHKHHMLPEHQAALQGARDPSHGTQDGKHWQPDPCQEVLSDSRPCILSPTQLLQFWSRPQMWVCSMRFSGKGRKLINLHFILEKFRIALFIHLFF